MSLFEISLQHIHTPNYISLSKFFVRNVVRIPLATSGNQGPIGSSVHVHFEWLKNEDTKEQGKLKIFFCKILNKCLCICSVIKIPQRSSAQCEVQILQPFLGHGNVSIQFKSKAYLLSLNYINIVFYQSKTSAVKKVNQTNFYHLSNLICHCRRIILIFKSSSSNKFGTKNCWKRVKKINFVKKKG